MLCLSFVFMSIVHFSSDLTLSHFHVVFVAVVTIIRPVCFVCVDVIVHFPWIVVAGGISMIFDR